MSKTKLATLDDIMLETGTDKNANGHAYAAVYGELFEPLRAKPLTFVELGVYQGASLRAWSKYFTNPNADIIGVDVSLKEYRPDDDTRIGAWEMDVTSIAFYNALRQIGPVDVIVDDASHLIADQRRAQNQLWPLLAPGGYYIIEDLHTWWWPQSNPADAPSFAHELVDNTLGRGRTRADGYDTDLARVLVYPSLLVMQKK